MRENNAWVKLRQGRRKVMCVFTVWKGVVVRGLSELTLEEVR